MSEEERFEKLLATVGDTLKDYPCLSRLLGNDLLSRVRENRKKYRATRSILFHMLLSARLGGPQSGGKDEIAQLEEALELVGPWGLSAQPVHKAPGYIGQSIPGGHPLPEGLKEGLLSPIDGEQASAISFLLAMSYFKRHGYSIVPQEKGHAFIGYKEGLRFYVRTLALPESPYMEEKLASGGEDPPPEVLEETIPWLTQRFLELDNTPCPEGTVGVLFLQVFDNLSGDMGRDDEIIRKASTAYFSRGSKDRIIIYIHYILEKAEVIYSSTTVPGL